MILKKKLHPILCQIFTGSNSKIIIVAFSLPWHQKISAVTLKSAQKIVLKTCVKPAKGGTYSLVQIKNSFAHFEKIKNILNCSGHEIVQYRYM